MPEPDLSLTPTQLFDWIPFYRALATELQHYRDRQAELIEFLHTLHTEGLIGISFDDQESGGNRFRLREMDGFTFFAMFNRQIASSKRIAILHRIQQYFHIDAAVPETFSGVPLVNNQQSWFFSYSDERKPGDVDALWDVFIRALLPDPLADPAFEQAFDRALQVRGTSVNLTMGLFWIRPDKFLNLDSVNRSYLGLKIPPAGLSFAFYKETLAKVSSAAPRFPTALPHTAWLENLEKQ